MSVQELQDCLAQHGCPCLTLSVRMSVQELQDCLAQHGWQLEGAMAALTDQAERAARSPPAESADTAKPTTKRRRLVVMDSDSSDEEGKPARQTTVPPANGHTQNGAAKREGVGMDWRWGGGLWRG